MGRPPCGGKLAKRGSETSLGGNLAEATNQLADEAWRPTRDCVARAPRRRLKGGRARSAGSDILELNDECSGEEHEGAPMPTERTSHSRAKPGASGHGRFFHVELRPPGDFVRFRVQDVGGKGGIERVAGQRASGSWDTQKWLIGKEHAHLEGRALVPDSAEARKLLNSLGSPASHVIGDRFKAKPLRDIPESEKPMPAMRRARLPKNSKVRTRDRKNAKS